MAVTTRDNFDPTPYRYHNVQPLERISGNMADLYTANVGSPGSNQQVVLKVSLTQGESVIVSQKMLISEMGTLQRILHPHIVSIFPIEQESFAHITYYAQSSASGHPYFGVLEWIRGGSLQESFLQEKQFSLGVAIEMGRQTADALQHIHNIHRIVHMDLKPSHLLLRQPPTIVDSVETVLIDFGSACAIGMEMTESATVKLHNFLSPERIEAISQRRTYKATPGDDIYALGLILYQLLTNRQPFPQKDSASRVQAILSAPPIAPSQLVTGSKDQRGNQSWQALDTLILNMLQIKPEARPTAQQVAIELREALFRFGYYAQAIESTRQPVPTANTKMNNWSRAGSVGLAALGFMAGFAFNRGIYPQPPVLPTIQASPTTLPTPSATDTPVPTNTEPATITPIATSTPTIVDTATPTAPPPTIVPTSTRTAPATATPTS